MVSAACGNCNHFGRHSTPILFLLYPLHGLIWNPLFLVSVHTVVLFSALIPLRMLTRLKLAEPEMAWQRLAIVISFICSPFFIKIWEYQFHPEVFYVPLFFWFVYFLEKQQLRLLWLMGVLICSVKEDGAIYLASASGAAALTRRLNWKQALALVAFSVGVFEVNTQWVIPFNSGQTQYTLAGTASRYGSTLKDFILGALTHPLEAVGLIFKGKWLSELFRFLFLPLLEPFFLVAILPFVAITSWAQSDVMRGLATYYSAPYLPWMFIGLIFTLARSNWPGTRQVLSPRAKTLAVVFLLLSSLPSWFAFRVPQSSVGALEFEEFKSRLDLTRSICAQSAIFPRLGYPPQLELLGPECVSKKMETYVFNRELGYWPFSQGELERMIGSLEHESGYREQRVGSFLILSRP